MTLSLDTIGYCNYTSSFRVGDFCQFQLTIMVPSATSTTMYIELFTSDNSSDVMAQLCKPAITYGSNYNISSAPTPLLTSSLANTQV